MSQIEDSAAAYRRALAGGVIQTWLDGKQIQWSADRNAAKTSNLTWYDLDAGSAPDFAAVGRHWRVKPVPPVIQMVATADRHPLQTLSAHALIVQVNSAGTVLVTTAGEFQGDFWITPFKSAKVEALTDELWEDDY